MADYSSAVKEKGRFGEVFSQGEGTTVFNSKLEPETLIFSDWRKGRKKRSQKMKEEG